MPHSFASPSARSPQDVQGGTTGSAGPSSSAADHPKQADASGQTSSSDAHTTGLHGAGAASQSSSSGAAVPAEVASPSLSPCSSAAASASNQDGARSQPSCEDEEGPLSAHSPRHFPAPAGAAAAGIASNSVDSFDQPEAVQQGSWASATRAASHRTAADSPAPAEPAVQEFLLCHAVAADSPVDDDASVPASSCECLAQNDGESDGSAAEDSAVQAPQVEAAPARQDASETSCFPASADGAADQRENSDAETPGRSGHAPSTDDAASSSSQPSSPFSARAADPARSSPGSGRPWHQLHAPHKLRPPACWAGSGLECKQCAAC